MDLLITNNCTIYEIEVVMDTGYRLNHGVINSAQSEHLKEESCV